MLNPIYPWLHDLKTNSGNSEGVRKGWLKRERADIFDRLDQEETKEFNEDMVIPLREHENKWFDLLGGKEKDLISEWTQTQRTANEMIFNNDPTIASVDDLPNIKELDMIIEKSSIPIDVKSYSGIPGEDLKKLGGSFEIGDEFTFKGYMCTSIFPRWALNFTDDQGCVLEIESPKGTNAIFMYKNRMHGYTEWELALKRNEQFVVKGIRTNEKTNTKIVTVGRK